MEETKKETKRIYQINANTKKTGEKKIKHKNVGKKVQSNGEAHLFVEKVPMQSETMESILWIQII